MTESTASRYAIFDDLLTADEYNRLGREFERLELRHVHADGVVSVFRFPDDGNPLVGQKTIAWPSGALAETLPAGIGAHLPRYTFYPTGTVLDRALEAVKGKAAQCHTLLGRENWDWVGIAATPQVYPAGTGLSWHSDSGPYAGAFVLYVHPEWNCQWGGELLVANPTGEQASLGEDSTGGAVRFGNRAENERLLMNGTGTFIMPKPNRLVFLAGGTPHAIVKVAAAAGNHLRASLSGFFLKPEVVVRLSAEASRPHDTGRAPA